MLTMPPVCTIASGLSGSTATAQSQVSVGMGLFAGSTVMLLTILWGTCLVVGKCDIENSIALDHKDTKIFSLTGIPLSFGLRFVLCECFLQDSVQIHVNKKD